MKSYDGDIRQDYENENYEAFYSLSTPHLTLQPLVRTTLRAINIYNIYTFVQVRDHKQTLLVGIDTIPVTRK